MLLLLDLLEDGLDDDSMGVCSSSLNLAVAVTLVTLLAPLGEELLDEPWEDPCNEILINPSVFRKCYLEESIISM